jgi:hypothetical protein
LLLARPPAWAEGRLVEGFPGWAKDIKVEQVFPPFFPLVDPRANARTRAVATRIADLGRELLSRCTDAEVTMKLRTILLPAYVELAPAKGWFVTPEHVRQLAAHWEQAYFVRRLRQAPNPTVIEALWEATMELGNSVAEAISALFNAHVPLLSLLMEQVPEEVFVTTLAKKGFGPFIERAFERLPPRLSSHALRAWARPGHGGQPPWHEVREILGMVTRDELDALVEVLADVDTNLAFEFAQAVWGLDRSRAREETAATIERHDAQSQQVWFFAAPLSETPSLVPLIENLDDADEWVPRWGRQRLLDAGEYADVLYQLVRDR